VTRIPTQLFINGSYRDSASGQRTALVNPATEERFAEVTAADLKDLNWHFIGAEGVGIGLEGYGSRKTHGDFV